MAALTFAQFARLIEAEGVSRVESSGDGGEGGIILITKMGKRLVVAIDNSGTFIKLIFASGPKVRPPKPPKKGTPLIIDGRSFEVLDAVADTFDDGRVEFDLRVKPKG